MCGYARLEVGRETAVVSQMKRSMTVSLQLIKAGCETGPMATEPKRRVEVALKACARLSSADVFEHVLSSSVPASNI